MTNKKQFTIYNYMSTRELKTLIEREKAKNKIFTNYLENIIKERKKINKCKMKKAIT